VRMLSLLIYLQMMVSIGLGGASNDAAWSCEIGLICVVN